MTQTMSPLFKSTEKSITYDLACLMVKNAWNLDLSSAQEISVDAAIVLGAHWKYRKEDGALNAADINRNSLEEG